MKNLGRSRVGLRYERMRKGGGEGNSKHLELTLCRLRQCSSATSWWKLPSVTFNVSSKDNSGFCSGREHSSYPPE